MKAGLQQRYQLKTNYILKTETQKQLNRNLKESQKCLKSLWTICLIYFKPRIYRPSLFSRMLCSRCYLTENYNTILWGPFWEKGPFPCLQSLQEVKSQVCVWKECQESTPWEMQEWCSYLVVASLLGSLTNFKGSRRRESTRWWQVTWNSCYVQTEHCPLTPAIYHRYYHPYIYRDVHIYLTFCNNSDA